MSEQGTTKYSRQMDAAGRRARSQNQHLCRLLSNEVEKLEYEEKTARRQLLQEIHGVRLDLANQAKQKSELKRRGSVADIQLSTNQRPNQRPQSSPASHARKSADGRSLMFWAGKPTENQKRKYRYKRPQSAQAPLKSRTSGEERRELSAGLQKQLTESKALRRQSLTSLNATRSSLITPGLQPIYERRSSRKSAQFELSDELIVRSVSMQRRATVHGERISRPIQAINPYHQSDRRKSDFIS